MNLNFFIFPGFTQFIVVPVYPTKLQSYQKTEVTRLDYMPQMKQARDLIRNCMNSKRHTLTRHHLKVLKKDLEMTFC